MPDAIVSVPVRLKFTMSRQKVPGIFNGKIDSLLEREYELLGGINYFYVAHGEKASFEALISLVIRPTVSA